MTATDLILREATAADLSGIFQVRVAVVENALSIEQLAERGVTVVSVASSFLTDRKGWVAEQDEQIVAFSIADRASGLIDALFVLPTFEGRGIGGRLLELALQWLWQNGAECVHLHTAPQSRAARFYERRGWVRTGSHPGGDANYEFRRLPSP